MWGSFAPMHYKHARRALVLAIALCHAVCVGGQMLQTNSVHRTPAAERPVNDLWCFRCQTMDDNDKCANLSGESGNFSYKCKDDKRLCMIKRISYTTADENLTKSDQKMWSISRNCTKHCEPGCIIIGERTKLYACTSCCSEVLCNNGTGGAPARAGDGGAILRMIGCLLVAMLCADFIS